MSVKRKILMIAVVSMGFATMANAEMSAKDIMEKEHDVRKLAGAESVVKLIIKDKKGNIRERKFSTASKTYYDVEKRIMKFISPADVKGTGILTFDNEGKDDDMWIYMPALRKTRRIVSSDKGKSFMGSEFTNADITVSNLNDYSYKLLGSETVLGFDCWKIEATPVSDDIIDETGYSKKIIWVDKKTFVAKKTLFYDYDGELLKTMKAPEAKLVDPKNKKYQSTLIVVTNNQNGRESTMKIEKIVFNPNEKDNYFTTQFLEK